MKGNKITLFGEAAEAFGTSYAVISGLVKALGIQPKPVPYNGNAKGLDRKDLSRLRRSLGLKARAVAR